MVDLVSSIFYVLIIGGIAGYFIGYVVKKISYLALPIGVFAFLLIYLIYSKAFDLNLNELVATIKRFTNVLTPLGFTALATSAPFIGSFIVGLVLGLRRG